MTISGKFTYVSIARTAGCTPPTICNIRANLKYFGDTKTPSNGVGRRRSITPPMPTALCQRLIEKPDLYRAEMMIFHWHDFDSMSHALALLALAGWNKKVARRVAQETNADLRNFSFHGLGWPATWLPPLLLT